MNFETPYARLLQEQRQQNDADSRNRQIGELINQGLRAAAEEPLATGKPSFFRKLFRGSSQVIDAASAIQFNQDFLRTFRWTNVRFTHVDIEGVSNQYEQARIFFNPKTGKMIYTQNMYRGYMEAVPTELSSYPYITVTRNQEKSVIFPAFSDEVLSRVMKASVESIGHHF